MTSDPLFDHSLNLIGLTEKISHLRKIYFRAVPEICIERPCLITRYHLDNGLFKKNRISILEKARAYKYVLENRKPIVNHYHAYDKQMKRFGFNETPLFAGSTTSKFMGVPLYPEFLALTLWPELRTISNRDENPYYISEEDVDELNFKIFPHWIENNILELTRKKFYPPDRKDTHVNDKEPMSGMKLLQNLVFFLAGKPQCISHTIPDFSKVIENGLEKIIADTKPKYTASKDGPKKEFYLAIIEALNGIISYSNNLAAEAEALANKESDALLRKEFREIAKIHRHIPAKPARTFREGLTAIWICWIAIHLENANSGLSLGRLDQVLSRLYQKDIAKDKLDIRRAIELVCGLWLKIGDHVPAVPETAEQLFGGTGSNQAITVGGVNEQGKDAVNELTYVMLRATELMKLRDPNLNARYHPGVNSHNYLKRVCEVNINTGATPAIHNDIAVIKALESRGDTTEQARDYGIIGCVEPGSNGRFYGHSAAILLNLTSALELTLFDGRHRHIKSKYQSTPITLETGTPESLKTFEAFKKAFEVQTRWLIKKATGLNNHFGKVHQAVYPTPILSAFIEGPMQKAKDLIEGGASINSSGATIIGFADVVDSLSAIEQVVYKEKDIELKGLVDALRKNYKGFEPLRTRIMNSKKTPKYGTEHPNAIENAGWIVKMLDRAFKHIPNYRDGYYRVGYWTMTNHAGFGKLMQAMPNGRKARENFASGITPVSGVSPYLTETLNSVAKLPVESLTSGVALNLKHPPKDGDPDKMLNNLMAYVKCYFGEAAGSELMPEHQGEHERNCGMEIQFNIIDHQTLVKAVKYPDAYSDLLVRVSGYTAYFKDLNPQMQKEIIDRTEYRLSSGSMVPYDPFRLPVKER